MHHFLLNSGDPIAGDAIQLPTELADNDNNTFITLTNDYGPYDTSVSDNIMMNISVDYPNTMGIRVRVTISQAMECDDTGSLKVNIASLCFPDVEVTK